MTGGVSLALAKLVGLWLAEWPLRARFPYEWDSASHLLGAQHFDVYRHHPHPPGYPLYVLALKAARLLTWDVHAAAVALAYVATGAAALLTYRFSRARYGERPALLASALLLFSSPVAIYGMVASTYPFDLLGSVVSLAGRAGMGR